MPARLPVIGLFALGGTIAFVAGDDGRNATLSLDAVGLAEAVPALARTAALRPVSFRGFPSADLDFADIIALAGEIDAAVRAGAAGTVVTQGTDTLEETAYVLDRLVTTAAPVVVTGAMRNAGLPGADGPANLTAAVLVACSPLARGLGVLVTLNDEIHAARFVQKTHSASPAAFRSPSTGPLGWVNEGRVRIPLIPRRRTRTLELPAGTAVPAVALIRFSLGDGPEFLTYLERSGYAGAVVEVFGAGHAARRTLEALKRLAARMPVVFSSRTGSGEPFTSTADYPGSEKDLLAGGLISAAGLDGLKARVLLALLLTSGADRASIERAFAETVD